MEKRLTFKCCNTKCKRTYTLFREITNEQALIVACPYCNTEAVADLKPYRTKTVMRGGNAAGQALGDQFQFPDVIPTQPPD